MHRFSFSGLLLLSAISAGLAACGSSTTTFTVPVSAPNAYLLTSNDQIVGVDLDSMEFARSVRSIPRATTASTTTPNTLALEPGEVIQDIDYRNSEGVLYALTTLSGKGYIIRIDPSSGVILRVSTLVTEGTTTQIALSDTGTSYTIDFNPVVDRLRVIGSNGSNLRVDVSTGDTLTDTNIQSGNTITGAAYEDSFSSAGRGTQLFTLDSSMDRVNLQSPPNDGTQSNLKSLLGSTTNVESINGYDINPSNNTGLALLTPDGRQPGYTLSPCATPRADPSLPPPRSLTGRITYKSFTFLTTANPTVTALTNDNSVHTFRANQPSVVSAEIPLSGLTGTGAEKVIGLDFRQSDRTLYALSNEKNVYSVAVDGTLTSKSTLATTVTDQHYTLDLNPLSSSSPPNHLRLIGANLSTLVADVENGNVSSMSTVKNVSGLLPPVVKAAAYLNNFRGSTLTSLLVIDSANNALSVQDISGTSSDGTLTRRSALGITLDPSSPVGFDASGRNNENQLLMARTSNTGNFSLYRVNSAVTSNPLTLIDAIASSSEFIDIAIRF